MAVPNSMISVSPGSNDAPASRDMVNWNSLFDVLNGEIDLGNFRSSPTEAQRVTSDKLNMRTKCFVNLIPNGDMEGWDAGTSTYPAGWVAENTPSAVIRDTADTGYGAYCVKITTDAVNEGMKLTLTGLKASTIYRLICRAKATSGDTAQMITTGATTNVSVTTTSTSWGDLTGLITTDGSGTDVVVKLIGVANGDIVWFDSVVCTQGTAQTGFFPAAHVDTLLYINSDSDAVDVTPYGGPITIVADTGSGSVTIGGLANGIDGQTVSIVKPDTSNTLTIEHNEGTGTQKIYTHDEGDVALTGYGGMILKMIAGVWYEVGR